MLLEAKEQTKIKKHLEREGWIVVKTVQLSESGYPDLFAFKDGITLFIEVKREKGGRLSEIQKYRIEKLTEQNFKVLVSHGYKEFITQFQSL